MHIKIVTITYFLLFLNSCIVQSPKYTTLEQVMHLELGMTKMEVEKQLGIEPYDIKAYTDSNDVYMTTISVLQRTKTNGKAIKSVLK